LVNEELLNFFKYEDVDRKKYDDYDYAFDYNNCLRHIRRIDTKFQSENAKKKGPFKLQ